MRALGFSQREIADEIGVSQPSVAYQLRKLKQMAAEGPRDEVLSKVLLGGFLDSLSGSALLRFLQFSPEEEEALEKDDDSEDAIYYYSHKPRRELNWVKLNQTMLRQIISHIQNTGTDQVLIFLPSKGPKGSILRAPRIPLAIIQ